MLKPLPVIVLALLVVAVILSTFLFLPMRYGHPDNPGVFGDRFGAANALFSGVGFIALVYAVLIQLRELQDQRTNFQDSLRLAAMAPLLSFYTDKLVSLRAAAKPDSAAIDSYVSRHTEVRTRLESITGVSIDSEGD